MQPTTTRKVTISLPGHLVAFADSKAAERGTSRSNFISDLLEELRKRDQDALAKEGYQFFAAESREWAEMSARATAEAIAEDRSPR